MKPKSISLTSLMTACMALPAAADVIYSNLRDIDIPANFAGVYLDVETGLSNTDIDAPQAGWDINPFFGGSVLWNSPTFQPVRSGTDSKDAVLNLAVGTMVSGGSVYATFLQPPEGENPGGPGFGGSETHLGAGAGQFAAGDEGFLGFQLNGTNHGWMRVVFTNNTGGALIKDWAYENSGASIATGNVLQNGSVVTLDSAFGSFTLGSQLDGSRSVVKTGANAATLTGVNPYSGDTTINQGSLFVNGSTTGSGAVSVSAGATLGGTGSMVGAVNVSGSLSPGASVESFSTGALTMNAGSTFVYQAADSGSIGADLLLVNGALSLTDVSLDLTGADLGLNTWNAGDKVTLISYTGAEISSGFVGYADKSMHTGGVFGSNVWIFDYNDPLKGNNFAAEANGDQFVTLTMIPEPSTALLCCVGVLAFRRRRTGAPGTR